MAACPHQTGAPGPQRGVRCMEAPSCFLSAPWAARPLHSVRPRPPPTLTVSLGSGRARFPSNRPEPFLVSCCATPCPPFPRAFLAQHIWLTGRCPEEEFPLYHRPQSEEIGKWSFLPSWGPPSCGEGAAVPWRVWEVPLPGIQLNWGSGFLPLLLPSQWPLSPADSPVLPDSVPAPAGWLLCSQN